MTSELASAFVLGLVGGAIPGPVLAAIFTEILQSGLIKSFKIIFQAMFTESLVALTSLVVIASLHLSDVVFNSISLIGGAVLLWIASGIWKITKIDTKSKVKFSFWKISTMILANGVLWTFWITVCVPKAINLNTEMRMGAILFLLLVELGWLISTSAVAFLFSQFRSLLTKPKTIPLVFKFFSLTFVYFAINMFYKSIKFFLNLVSLSVIVNLTRESWNRILNFLSRVEEVLLRWVEPDTINAQAYTH